MLRFVRRMAMEVSGFPASDCSDAGPVFVFFSISQPRDARRGVGSPYEKRSEESSILSSVRPDYRSNRMT